MISMTPRSTSAWRVHWIAASVFALDVASKSVARAELPLSVSAHPHGVYIYGMGGLERVGNAGSPLGYAQGDASWLPLAALGLVLALALPYTRERAPIATAATGLLAGGGLGNLADRVRFGAVTDFLLIGSSRSGILLNPADLALMAGVLLALACKQPPRHSQRGGEQTWNASSASRTPQRR